MEIAVGVRNPTTGAWTAQLTETSDGDGRERREQGLGMLRGGDQLDERDGLPLLQGEGDPAGVAGKTRAARSDAVRMSAFSNASKST